MKYVCLSLLLVACSGDDAPTAADADTSRIDASVDAAVPPDAGQAVCVVFKGEESPCWPYVGVEQIGDQTCAHRWNFSFTDPNCVTQTGWALETGQYVANEPGAVLSIVRPTELPVELVGVDVTFHGGAEFFDTSACQTDEVCVPNANEPGPPDEPGECACPLQRSQMTVALYREDEQLLSTLSTPDGEDVKVHMECCYPIVEWDRIEMTTSGDGGLQRALNALRLEYREPAR